MDGPGFHVEIGVLEAAAAGVAETADDQLASALEKVERDAGAYGHDGVHASLVAFCDRWNGGLDILLKDAQAIADILGRAAWAYRDADAASAGRLTTDPGKRVLDD
jgi:hypothetical protein